MPSSITMEGIENVISNLNYRSARSLKYKYIHAIKSFYKSETSIDEIHTIDSKELIKIIWDTGDNPSLINAKRKNFSSIKSTVNSDLKKLYDKQENSEGITINSSNVFDMSDDAKNELLNSFDSEMKKKVRLISKKFLTY